MESGLRVLLLTGLAAAATGCSVFGRDSGPPEDAGASAPVISPEVERREVTTPKIDTEDFEVTGYVGQISVEDFGTNFIWGLRGAYHVTESLFIEGTYAMSGDVDRTSVEVLDNIDLLGEDRDYSYYDLAVGWNLLPGEVFIGRNHAFNSALYVLAGAGNTSFAGEDLFTLTFGAGYRVLATDSIALHFDVRDHLFDNDVTGEDKTTHNIEFNLGVSWFF
ncbi:MAG: outer membrane beta-barrel domain-containing protein [Gammaproteobacteria bacterium]|nr:outer membrane beta-barrel domain-containing protein [Gammaproteobacteria bacterium]